MSVAVAQGTVMYDTDPPFSPSVSASPWVYTNDSNTRVLLWFWGGTITIAAIQRGSSSFVSIGLLGGGSMVILNPGDSVRLTYILPPTVVAMRM